MYTALVLPLLLLAAPADKAVRAEQSVGGDDPAIQVWISNDRHFLPGEEATVQVKTREDGYLVVLHVDPDGHLRVLFPIDPGDDNYARGGKKYNVRGRGGHGSFTTDDTKGRGTVYAAVSHDPFRFDQFVLGDHWDYHQLSPQRFSTEPEQELNDLVRRMADGGFDYDILTYDVVERVVYANDYSSSGGWYGAYAGCGYSYYGCARGYYGYPYGFSFGFSFGAPYYPYYHRYYYDPFYAGYAPYYGSYFYSPYYRPYYYQPYYYRYRPVYAYPYYPHYGYGYPTPHGRYYGNGYGWTQPYAPYRFRGADGGVGYSNRRYSFARSVNTVYVPPSVRAREAVGSNPVRRVTDVGSPTDVRPATERRTTPPAGGTAHRAPERRTERVDSRESRPYVEARRARGPEERRSVVPDSRDASGRGNLATEVRPQSRSEQAPRRAVERSEEVRGPTEVRPLSRSDVPRRAVDRPEEVRGGGYGRSDGDGMSAPRGEARRAETGRSDPPPMRSDPQWADRGGDRGSDRGNDRGSYSPPARSDGGSSGGSYSPPARSDGGSSRGGWSGGGGGGGYHGGGAPSGGGARGGGGGGGGRRR